MVWKRYPDKVTPVYPRSWRAMKALAVVVALLALTLAWRSADPAALHELASLARPAAQAHGVRIHVTSVHDGDTFRIGAERVRVLGMDAPEIGGGAKCEAEQRAALRARDYLEAALQGDDLYIERDGFDVYGRTLARVYVNGRDIAPVMLAAGLARPYVPGRHGDWC
jgi:endonuclease YncB( thermonuclease family)